jgi:nitrile hydratase beta subunit
VDGIHDLGGMEGFGPVEVEADEPVFHFDWERRALGVTFASFALGLSNGGQFRHAIERMDAVHYLGSRYYEHWVTGTATRAVEAGLVDVADLDRRAGGTFPLSRPPLVDGPPAVETAAAARFHIGDQVRVTTTSARGHTRCPRYLRGHSGTVVRVDPAYRLPDVEAHSHDGGAPKEPVYCVRFTTAELWGDNAEPASVHVDLWESYLQ